MAEISKTVFPAIPSNHWLSLRAQFNRAIPGVVTPNYIASVLGMEESSAKVNIIPGLKQIGLIDNEGKTVQEVARRFRDDTEYPKLCAEIVNKLYPQDLRDAFPDKGSDREKVKTWFKNHTGIGDSGARKVSAFYSLLVEGDPNLQVDASKSDSKPKASKTTNITAKSKVSVKQQAPIAHAGLNATPAINGITAPDININLQIHISSDASPDQIKSIFENMAKYLYNKPTQP